MPAADPEEHPDEATSRLDLRAVGRRVALFLGLGVLGLLAVLTLPGVDEVRERLRAAEPGWLLAAGVFEGLSMLGFALTLWAAFGGRTPVRAALPLGFAEQGANVLLPAGGTGGPAFGTLVMRRAGVPAELAAERHVVVFLVTSAVSFVALVLAGTAEASGVLPGDVPLVGSVLPAALALLVLLLALAFATADPPPEPDADAPASGLHRVSRAVGRVRRFLHGGAATTVQLLREGDRWLLVGAVAYYAFDVATLAAAFEAFGGGAPSLPVFVLAYTIGHAGALLPTPGGVGGTDGGLIGMFVVYGAPLGLTTAAVLGYRVFQLGLPVVLGAVGLLRIQRRLADPDLKAQVERRYAGVAS